MTRLFATLATVFLIACGGSGTTSSDGGGGGQSNVCLGRMGVSQQCVTCETTSCDAQTAACLGPGYKSGNFSGPCADFITCTCKCGASDFNCLAGCQGKYSSACMSCSNTLDACVRANCGSVCQLPAAGDMASSSGGGCIALASCCASLPADQQSGCNGIVAAGNDAQCSAALSGYESAGECK